MPILGEQIGIKVGSFLHTWQIELPPDRGEIKQVTGIGLKPSLNSIQHEIHLSVRTPTSGRFSRADDGLNEYDEFDDTERPILAEFGGEVATREEIVTCQEAVPLQLPIPQEAQDNLILRVKNLEQRLTGNNLKLAAVMQLYEPANGELAEHYEPVRAEFALADEGVMNMELVDANAQLIPNPVQNSAQLQLKVIVKDPQCNGPESFQEYNFQQEVDWTGRIARLQRLPSTRLDIANETLIWEGLRDMGEIKDVNELNESNELKELNTREVRQDEISFPWLKDWMEGKDVFPAGEESSVGDEEATAAMGNTTVRAEDEFDANRRSPEENWTPNELENFDGLETVEQTQETEDPASDGILQVNWQDMLQEESETPNMFVANNPGTEDYGLSVKNWNSLDNQDSQELGADVEDAVPEIRSTEESDLAEAYAKYGWRSANDQLEAQDDSPADWAPTDWENTSQGEEVADVINADVEEAMVSKETANRVEEDPDVAETVTRIDEESLIEENPELIDWTNQEESIEVSTQVDNEIPEEFNLEANAEVRQDSQIKLDDPVVQSGEEYFNQESEVKPEELVDELDRNPNSQIDELEASSEPEQADIYAVDAPEPSTRLAAADTQSFWQKINPFKSEAKAPVCKKPASRPRPQNVTGAYGLNSQMKHETQHEPPITVSGLIATRPMRKHITPSSQLPSNQKLKSSSNMRMYLVKPGDTWETISQKFGVSRDVLMAANGLDELPINDMIRVPKA